MDFNNLLTMQRELRNHKYGILVFAERICGLPVTHHMGQVRWLVNSHKRINILRPGNKYGKSLIGAVRHLYHHFTKINIDGMYRSVDDWMKIKYDTLNFGPGYEQAREILRMARDIAEGNVFIPQKFQDMYGVTNRSLLKEWFVVEDRSDATNLPFIRFITGGSLLGRSYSEMGAAFKMKGIAYVSGDEVADIDELWTFTNGTLLPRGVAYKNFAIDYYGTPQADGQDYMRMIEMAEDDMKKKSYMREGMFYHQKGSMYENPFLDEDTVKDLERIADPVLRKQVLEGEYVESGEKYFGFERINNAVDKQMKMTSMGELGHKYIISCDFAGGDSTYADFTVIMVVDYTEEPYRVKYIARNKGSRIPIPSQYRLVEEVYKNFRTGGTEGNIANVRLIIDGSALGGKNAVAFLKHLNPYVFDVSGRLKGEMLATLKIAFDGGQSERFRRKLKILPTGEVLDDNPVWGMVKIPDEHFLIHELQNYKLDDSKIKTDCVMTLGMAVHYLELQRPRKPKNRMMDFDLLGI